MLPLSPGARIWNYNISVPNLYQVQNFLPSTKLLVQRTAKALAVQSVSPLRIPSRTASDPLPLSKNSGTTKLRKSVSLAEGIIDNKCRCTPSQALPHHPIRQKRRPHEDSARQRCLRRQFLESLESDLDPGSILCYGMQTFPQPANTDEGNTE